MQRLAFLGIACLAALASVSCKKKNIEIPIPANNTLFEPGQVVCIVKDEMLEEASGLAESKANPGLLWTHNDSGDKARIFLIDTSCNIIKTVWLNGVKNRDWEDMAIGPGPEEGKTYLYIADIGDNEAEHNKKYIYRIEEPTVSLTQAKDTTIQQVDVIKVVYPDEERDAESFMVDPITRDLFIISKRELKANLYRIPYPQSTTEIITAEIALPRIEFDKESVVDTIRKKNGEVLIRGYHPEYYYQIVGADISPDGSEVLVKSYSSVYYWKRNPNETITEVLARPSTVLPYNPEPQGEAITFNRSGGGYYTINEKMRGKEQRLIFYKRKVDAN